MKVNISLLHSIYFTYRVPHTAFYTVIPIYCSVARLFVDYTLSEVLSAQVFPERSNRRHNIFGPGKFDVHAYRHYSLLALIRKGCSALGKVVVLGTHALYINHFHAEAVIGT